MIPVLSAGEALIALLLAPGSPLSISSLVAAGLIAAGFLAVRRHRRRHPLRFARLVRVLRRALFRMPARFKASHLTDGGFTLLNVFCTSALIGWAIVSFNWVADIAMGGLVGAFGAQPVPALPSYLTSIVLTLALFLAYEFAYWLDHYLSHRVPLLWEFHRVHHEAEALTPLTVFRVHPIDTLVFQNITSVVVGITYAACMFMFGRTAHAFTIFDVNILMVLAMHSVVQLQHSHVWIPFTGLLGRVVMSPAHHQVHHSTNPVHFNKNLGGALSLFDWVFGTLHVPSRTPEKLTFGVPQERPDNDPHSVRGGMLDPFVRALRHVAAAVRGVEFRPQVLLQARPDRTRQPAPQVTMGDLPMS